MPSTVGHFLGGVACVWGTDLVPGRRAWRGAAPSASWFERAGAGFTLGCGVLAASPDLDLLFHAHRTVTHSIGAVIFVGLFAAAMAVQSGLPVRRVVAMCAGAYASHLLLDWLAADRFFPYGIQALWPFSHNWYISGIDLFPQTERRNFFTWSVIKQDTTAVVREVVILGPTCVALWLVRVKALAGLAPKLTRSDHSSE